MSGRDEDTKTLPPPPGEADAYNARTRIGEMPPELMAELRAGGLMPSRSEAEPVTTEREQPEPPRPDPPAAAAPPLAWPSLEGRRASQAFSAVSPGGAERGASGPTRLPSSSSLAARLATEARASSAAPPRRSSSEWQPAIRRTASSHGLPAVAAPPTSTATARSPDAAPPSPSPREAAYLAAGFTVEEVPTAPTLAALDPRVEPAGSSNESGEHPRPSAPSESSQTVTEEPSAVEASAELERPPVTDSQTLSRPPGAHLQTAQPPVTDSQTLARPPGAHLQMPSREGGMSSEAESLSPADDALPLDRASGEPSLPPAPLADAGGLGDDERELMQMRSGRLHTVVALAVVVLVVLGVLALSLQGK